MKTRVMRADLAADGVSVPAFSHPDARIYHVDAYELEGACVISHLEPHYVRLKLKDGRQLYFVEADLCVTYC